MLIPLFPIYLFLLFLLDPDIREKVPSSFTAYYSFTSTQLFLSKPLLIIHSRLTFHFSTSLGSEEWENVNRKMGIYLYLWLFPSFRFLPPPPILLSWTMLPVIFCLEIWEKNTTWNTYMDDMINTKVMSVSYSFWCLVSSFPSSCWSYPSLRHQLVSSSWPFRRFNQPQQSLYKLIVQEPWGKRSWELFTLAVSDLLLLMFISWHQHKSTVVCDHMYSTFTRKYTKQNLKRNKDHNDEKRMK